MICKLLFRFNYSLDVKSFTNDLRKIDDSGTFEIDNHLTVNTDEDQAESIKGLKIFIQYENLQKVVNMMFENYSDVYLLNLKTFGSFDPIKKQRIEERKDKKTASIKEKEKVKKKNEAASCTKWTDEDNNTLKELFDLGKTDREIGEVLQRSHKAIAQRRRRLELKR